MKRQKIVITIKAEFGSTFQEEFSAKLLQSLLQAFVMNGEDFHSQNRFTFEIDFGGENKVKSMGYDKHNINVRNTI